MIESGKNTEIFMNYYQIFDWFFILIYNYRKVIDRDQIQQKKMIQQQLIERGISSSKVLDVMAKLNRKEFVMTPYKEKAFQDSPLPLIHGQTISQPYIVALMSEKLELEKNHRVFEIGTGSAYQTAILAELAAEVWSIERIQSLYQRAKSLLKKMGYSNVHLFYRDGFSGLPEWAPFDRIILTAAPEMVPQALLDQLSLDGILVAPARTHPQQLYRFWRKQGRFERELITYVTFVSMLKGLD